MKNCYFLFLTTLIVSAWSSVGLSAAIERVDSCQFNYLQYEKVEWEIQLVAEWSQSPHMMADVALDMHLIAPSGTPLVLPCYYEQGVSGGRSFWRARFTPTEAGVYQYDFVLKTAANGVSKTEKGSFEVIVKDSKGFLHTNNRWSFKFDNGECFRGIGYNIGWESRTFDDSQHFGELHQDGRFNYVAMLKTLAESGGNFFRTWMIYWNLPLDWKDIDNNHRYTDSDEFFNPSGIERMDQLLELCEQFDVYMMLAIDSHASFLGDGWKRSPYNVVNGGSIDSADKFFTDPEAKVQYQSKLRYLVARWGYSPHIAVWEFFNEVDNIIYAPELGEKIPDEVVANWHREMSEYLKTIDPYGHLISTSVSHRDVEGMNALVAMDFNQRHIYRHTADIPTMITDNADAYNKPYVIGEYGYEWDWQKNFDDFADEMDHDFYQGLWYGLFHQTPVLPMSWWWEYFENRGTVAYLKHINFVNQVMLSANDGDREWQSLTVNTGSADVLGYGMKIGDKVFVFLENQSANDVNLQFPLDLEANDILEVYHFESEAFEAVDAKDLSIEIGYREFQIYQVIGL